MPFISVIVPVYNVEEYLDRCCESLVNQSYQNIEIILIDDGAKDKSGVLCDKWQERDRRITCIHKENEGVSAARNEGIRVAKGEYITFVDADDWIDLDTYEVVAEQLMKDQVDIVKFGYQKVQNGKVIGEFFPLLEENKKFGRQDIQNSILPDTLQMKPLFTSKKVIVSACMQVFRRSLLVENKIWFHKVLNEDPLFSLEAMSKANSCLVIKKAFYHYDTRLGSATQQYINKMYDGKLEMYRKYKRVVEENNSSEEVMRRLELYYINCIYGCINNECRKVSNRKLWEAVKQIRFILHSSNVKEVIQKADLKGTSKKGKLLLVMMKYQMSLAIFWTYRTFIRN